MIQGGGGGSSYIGGYNGYINGVHVTIPVRIALTISGDEEMPSPNGGSMIGNVGPCIARFIILEKE